MLRKLLLVSLLSFTLAAFGQKGSGGGSAPSGSTGATGATGASGLPVMPTTQSATGGLAGQQAQAPGLTNPSQTDIGPATIPETMGGPAGTTGTTQQIPGTSTSTTGIGSGTLGFSPAGGAMLTTPSATFDSPQPTAGMSDAGRAGITNSTPINTGLAATLSGSTVVYTSVPVGAPVAVSPATVAVSARGPANDLGASYYSDSIGAPAATGPSVAEIAQQYKERRGVQTVKTYTNADVPPENPGMLANPTLEARIQPPTLQSSSSTTAPAPATRSPFQAPPSPSNQQTTQSQSGQNSTTPQVNQSQQTNETEATGLPSTSTLLPLLGLLGFASSGIGIWYRRHRK